MNRNTDLAGDVDVRAERSGAADHATAGAVAVEPFVLPEARSAVIHPHHLETVVHKVHGWYSFIKAMVQNVCLAPKKLFYPVSCLEDIVISGVFTVGSVVAHTFPAWRKRIHLKGYE